MHLAQIVALRARPASAVCLAVTQRCPLSCRHCSTDSTLGRADPPTGPLRRFVATFTEADHPDLAMMSGGEALLKADLVRWIAESCRAVGTSSYLLSGMYFARERAIPAAVRRAIDAVDHFAASIDAFHEEEVPRAAVIRILSRLADDGKDVSVQLVGLDDDDPYLAEAVDDIRTRLGDRVPILVNHVAPHGRAARWLHTARPPGAPSSPPPEPCMLASWPLVRYDGAVLACCKQTVIDMPVVPEHLLLGHAAVDDWRTIRDRTLSRDLLRAIRVVGPQAVRHAAGGSPRGYCESCYGLAGDPAAKSGAQRLMGSPTMPIVERTVVSMLRDAGPEEFVRAYASPRYAGLVTLGGPDAAAAHA
jgi:pyruvate-formate lyase-activating enzyme